MKSLAEHLGVADPLKPDAPVSTPVKTTAKTFCRDILASSQYRESLLRRILLDELPPAVECMLWERAHGKIPNRVEVDDVTNRMENWTAEQLEERARVLLDFAKRHRLNDDPGDDSPSSIH